MKLAATFLVGAKGRLLPASIPFRFFAAAVVFHGLMWLVLVAHPDDVVRFRGGPGPGLAAVHLLTLGVLTTTAIGASLQLLPVATRQPIAALWPIKLMSWLVLPGLTVLITAMYLAQIPLMIAAAAVTGAGLLLYGSLCADNLRRAGSLPIVAAYGWAALAALTLLVVLGLLLAIDYQGGWLADHNAIALVHVIVAGFGFMGMLALGFSHVLVPMFALASAPSRKPAALGLACACAAIAVATLGALTGMRALLLAALAIGLGAAAIHLWLMHGVLADGMRKRLGLSFVFIRAAWGALPLCLLTGGAHVLGLAGDNGATLFGLLLFGVWLLTFVLGILQRILPFLASMHGTGGAPHVPQSGGFGPLELHALCHGAAIAALVIAIVAGSPLMVRAGGSIGLVGAVAFGWFAYGVISRMAANR